MKLLRLLFLLIPVNCFSKSLIKKIVSLFIITAYFNVCLAQEIFSPLSKPESVGISSDQLQKINPHMQRYVDEKKLPGLITLVARHEKIVSAEKFGVMDVDKPMQFNAIFRLASMTKPITSLAVMMLYEEGYFKLEDPVAKYIPEFSNLKVLSSIDKNGLHVEDPVRPMTIADLLTHTSGLGNGWEDDPVDSMYRVADLSAGTLHEMIQKLAAIPLIYQPGTHWNYGRSTDVLGYLIEVVSGKPFDVFLRERIFIPLKMKDTDFFVSKEKLKRVAAIYAQDDSVGFKLINPDTTDITKPAKFLSGNGGLFSTAMDYMIFSQLILNKGEYNGVRLLKGETVDLMTANHLTTEIMPQDEFMGPVMAGMGFGYGFAIVRDQNTSKKLGSVGSCWWSGSANTYFFIDPAEDLTMVLMTQFVPNYYYPVQKEFRDLVYKSLVD